jgi:hypothetical protein
LKGKEEKGWEYLVGARRREETNYCLSTWLMAAAAAAAHQSSEIERGRERQTERTSRDATDLRTEGECTLGIEKEKKKRNTPEWAFFWDVFVFISQFLSKFLFSLFFFLSLLFFFYFCSFHMSSRYGTLSVASTTCVLNNNRNNIDIYEYIVNCK